MKICFIAEVSFPDMKGGGTSIKDQIISLFPDYPCDNDEEFHKENMGALVFGFLHHCMERQVEVPDDAQVRPTDLAELIGEE
jgi:hypothetical protein